MRTFDYARAAGLEEAISSDAETNGHGGASRSSPAGPIC